MRHSLKDLVALVPSNANDTLGEPAVDEHALPAGDRVDADDGVDCLEVVTLVQGATTDVCADLVAEGLSDILEDVCLVGSGEGLEVSGEGGREAVVDFVTPVHRVKAAMRIQFEC